MGERELIELCLKKISDLENKIEMYYTLLNVGNELDFVMKGTYISDTDMANFLAGNYRSDKDLLKTSKEGSNE